MNRAVTLIEIIIVIFIVIIIASCSGDTEGAQTALNGMGFKNVTLHDSKWFSGCGEGERNSPFTATNPTGQQVSGVVCCGGLLSTKGCTVRF